MNARRVVLVLLPLLFVSCAGGAPKGDSISLGEPAFEGFPAQTLENIVYAQAHLPSDHERVFGVDLIEKEGVIPIALSVQLRGENMESAQILLSAERMDLALFLPDGTALPLVSAERVASPLRARFAEKVMNHAFRPGLLGAEPTEGYVFFKIAPAKEIGVEDGKVLHATSGVARPMRLTGCLLTFNVTIGDHIEPFFVGLQR